MKSLAKIASTTIAGASLLVFGSYMALAAPQHPCFGNQEIFSPGKNLVARITRHGSFGCGESIMEIADRFHKVIASQDFTSTDGEHGETVEVARWSGDGRYFVFSLSSSGGHEVLHFPLLAYSLRSNRFANLEDKGGSYIDDPNFALDKNDYVHVHDSKGRQIIDLKK